MGFEIKINVAKRQCKLLMIFCCYWPSIVEFGNVMLKCRGFQVNLCVFIGNICHFYHFQTWTPSCRWVYERDSSSLDYPGLQFTLWGSCCPSSPQWTLFQSGSQTPTETETGWGWQWWVSKGNGQDVSENITYIYLCDLYRGLITIFPIPYIFLSPLAQLRSRRLLSSETFFMFSRE